jgi:hypothetical protein
MQLVNQDWALQELTGTTAVRGDLLVQLADGTSGGPAQQGPDSVIQYLTVKILSLKCCEGVKRACAKHQELAA